MLPRVIREVVRSQLSELAGHQIEVSGERLLIREGEYCGHRYEGDGFTAIWFREENEIKCYGPENRVVRAVNADEAVKRYQASQPATRPEAA